VGMWTLGVLVIPSCRIQCHRHQHPGDEDRRTDDRPRPGGERQRSL